MFHKRTTEDPKDPLERGEATRSTSAEANIEEQEKPLLRGVFHQAACVVAIGATFVNREPQTRGPASSVACPRCDNST